MKHIAFLFSTGLLLTVFGGSMLVAAPVQAETSAEQEQSQELKVKCETGSYGQSATCEAEGKQEQKQKIVIREKVAGVTHAPVNTALDLQTSAVAGLSILSGVGALVVKRKLSVV